MKKLILASLFCSFAAAVSAADKPDFSDLGFSAQLNAVTAQAPAVKVPEAVKLPDTIKEPVRAGRYVQVSGYVNLNGNGWLSPAAPNTPPTPSYTSVTLTGWATFSDTSGEVTSGNVSINVPAYMWVTPNQYVFQTVYPNVYAQFSYKGKPAGSASMSGSISVSGWPSGSFFSLSGSGTLSGSVYVDDAQ